MLKLVKKNVAKALCVSTLLISTNSMANYICTGQVSYLGIDASGNLVTAIANSTPIHYICNINNQGSFQMSVGSCKLAYASLVIAKQNGKSISLYYNDNLTCATFPSWGQVNSLYFVQGPD